ncbi:MAG TPA: hypothetical protein P5513_05915 [Candidatus Diapherotrites archaeon]|nr:hypothetical protein [Candidatus Diapherotrites archaeon]
MSKLIHRSKKLYWSLIVTFTALYLAVAFVSTLHAITFFQLANTLGLAILLGSAYEIGQAAVLFSILMTENRNRLLAWLMMFLLTALQITANVYASFKFIDSSGSNDWTYWQRAILFGVQADNQEMYKVIISWISGALLPLVALGMTALVADNIRLAQGEKLGEDNEDISQDRIEEIIENEVQKRLNEKTSELNNDSDELFELLPDNISDKKDINYSKPEENDLLIEEEDIPINNIKDNLEENNKDTNNQNGKYHQEPVNKMRGWNLMTEYVDNDHNVFSKGAFIKNDPEKIPTSKKVLGRA